MSVLNNKIIRTNLLSIITACVNIALFRYAYTSYLVPVWGYMGFQNNGTTLTQSAIVNLIVIFPILFYSTRKVISNFISVLLYCFAYVPIVIALDYYYADIFSVLPYYISLAFGMTLFFLSDSIKEKKYSLTRYIPLKYYILIGIVLTLIVVAYYGPSNLKLVSFYDIYDLRSANAEFRANAPLIGYFINWASKAFMPLFIGIGLIYKKRKLLYIGIGIAMLMYATTGQKSTILMPIILYLFNLVLKKFNFNYLFPSLVCFSGIVIWLVMNVNSEFTFMLGAVYLLRTLGISSILACSYIDVFDFGTTPYTYYSHIGIVNSITGMYPFNDPALGKAVWSVYSGGSYDESMNANANFWITDGIAAGGFVGVIFISVFFFYLLKLLNSISYRHDNNFVFLTCLGVSMSLLNVSLFTTLITGGLIIIMTFYRYTTVSNRLYKI